MLSAKNNLAFWLKSSVGVVENSVMKITQNSGPDTLEAVKRYNRSLGDRIEQRRMLLGLSLRSLAALAGTTCMTIKAYEHGRIARPKIYGRIVKALEKAEAKR